ncbi:RAI1-domain-containing protein [Anaeromyces robustus]|uniref:Decapping nuclease n=1 Tax=Anaeromyces robustus TaxID=1754192 RepID=A0A1Y1XQ26_9FUNG|nr:RAI1-domain-containing protein [Anaeromyces robustus]|eukprot:ORX87765.1 RAI1-domain-containing protein [Anaeromyces robustus]
MEAQFKIPIINKLKHVRVNYSQPLEISNFSVDINRQLQMDDRVMKYYYPMDMKFNDLTEGFETFNRKVEKPEPLDNILKTLKEKNHLTFKNVNDKKPDFITWRGLIVKIMCVPYLRKNGFELIACNYDGIIYIQEPQDKKPDINENDITHQKFCYSGFKFETLSTIPIPPEELKNSEENKLSLLNKRIKDVVNNKEEYGIIVQSKLNDLRLIMGAEVDCAERKFSHHESQKPYLELKTTKTINNTMDENSFERYKLIKFWAQSFLVGIPKIIIAFRNNDLKVEKISTLKTLNIPHLVNQHYTERQQKFKKEQIHDIVKQTQDNTNKKNYNPSRIKKILSEPWNANVCLAFAEQFLNWIKYEILQESDPTSSYTITFDPEKNKNMINIKWNGPHTGFLPNWWIN